jgi:nucleoside 2-deoxyribosyltransferase
LRIYLAASYNDKERIRLLSLQLEALGLIPVNHWQDEPANVELKDWSKYANRDLQDIHRCDVLVVLTDRPSTTGAYHFETGFAFALGKQVLVVGKRTNFFHHLPHFNRVTDWKAAKQWLVKLESSMTGKN